MPPKAKKSKKEIEEEKSNFCTRTYHRFYRKTRGRKENTGGAREEEAGGRGATPQDRRGEETRRGGKEESRRGEETPRTRRNRYCCSLQLYV